jgi:hypothetical protein
MGIYSHTYEATILLVRVGVDVKEDTNAWLSIALPMLTGAIIVLCHDCPGGWCLV